ncbi:MAG: hypothetical protein R3F34_13425, partial [Planctomycetota bacterium]
GRGAGQFAASYPPYRDPVERRLSTSGTEVEHPHNDWLLVWVEYGWLGGLVATAVLGCVVCLCFSALRKQEVATNALGTALLALLVNAGAHSVLLGNAASGLIAAVACGACSAAHRGDGPNLVRRSRASLATLVVSIAIAIPAFSHWQLGRALAAYQVEAKNAFENGVDAGYSDRIDADIADAVDACPDSVLARSLECAHALAWVTIGREPEASLERARRACAARLDARPVSPAALADMGRVELLFGEYDAARVHGERALEIDPEQAVALDSLARLEFVAGDANRGTEYLVRLEQLGLRSADDRRAFALEVLAQGAPPESVAVAMGADPTAPTKLFDLGRRTEDEFDVALAQHLFAHEHLDAGDVDAALVSLRQARRSYIRTEADAPLAALELLCAEELAGDADGARATFAASADLHDARPRLRVHPVLEEAEARLRASLGAE